MPKRNEEPLWGLSLSRSAKVAAPSSLAWQVVTGIDEYPKVLSSVTSVERDGVISRKSGKQQKNPKPIRVGTSWTETREYKEKTRKGTTTVKDSSTLNIIHMDSKSEPRVIKVSANWWGSMLTSTVQISRKNDKSCAIQFSMAIIPNNFWARLNARYLSRNKFEKLCYAVIEGDLKDWKTFLEARDG